jgi:hypothetical protein
MSGELCRTVRRVIEDLDRSGTGSAKACVEPLRALVQPNVHVGRKDLSPEETVEWYAGQILDIVDTEKWFAVNSLINCVDKFAPVSLAVNFT